MKKRLMLFVCLVMAITNIAFAATKPTLPAIDNACVGHTDYPDLVEIQDPASGIWFQVVLNDEDHTAKIVNRNFKWGPSTDNLDFTFSENGVIFFSLYSYYLNQISGEKLTIPSSFTYNEEAYTVTCIAEGVFAPQSTKYLSVKKIEVPSTVKEIKDLAFVFFGGEIILNEGIETIGKQAFRGQSNDTSLRLKKINLPNSIKEFGDFAFMHTDIQEVEFGENIESIGKYCFCYCPNLNTPTINACNIGSYAFYKCTSLTDVTVNANDVGDYAFNHSENLISASVTAETIGKSAFRYTKLNTVTLEGVQSIGNAAFADGELKKVRLPKTLTTLDPTAFNRNNGFIEYEVEAENPVFASRDGILLSKDLTKLISFPNGRGNTLTPTQLGTSCAHINNVGIVLLPPTITSIETKAFYNCPNMTKLVIPSKVTNIATQAFNTCTALKEVTFLCETKPTIVTSGTPSFNGCTGITSIKLRKSLKPSWNYTINGKAASTATLIPSVTDSYGTDEFIIVDGKAQLVATSKNVNSVVLPEAVTVSGVSYPVSRIGDYVFETSSKNCGATTREVIAFSDIDYVGVKAFGNGNVNLFMADRSGTDTDVDFATDIYELGSTYNEFAGGGQKIYVKKSACSDYATAWGKYSSQFDYQITTSDIMPNAQNGSFAREFAVDLSNDGANTVSTPQLIAFVPMRLNKYTDDTYGVRMQSINEDGAGDGTYIPAGTGVVLRKYGSTQPTYYEIAESQTNDNNVMSPAVICNAGQIPASTETLFNFYIGKSDGLAHKATKLTNIGVHKSYLSIAVPAGAKAVTFMFDDLEDDTTDVAVTECENTETSEWYSLTGQKTMRPSAGIFIRNGKKFIKK